MIRFPAAAAALLVLTGCGGVSFERHQGLQEITLRGEIKDYYEEVKSAFAARSAESLAALFDAGISRPMTWPKILAWARTFFAENASVVFHIKKLDFRDLGRERAVVELHYSVTTFGGKGDFEGQELDILEKRAGGHWRIVSWEKL